jgi:hypothetical protein
MRYLYLASLTVLAIVVQADSGAPPSVWEQMQLAGVSQEGATIESVEVNQSTVLINYKVGEDVRKAELCRDVRNEPFYGVTYQNQRVDMLRSALKSGDRVDLGLTGPWSPCLQSVKVSRAQ